MGELPESNVPSIYDVLDVEHPVFDEDVNTGKILGARQLHVEGADNALDELSVLESVIAGVEKDLR